MTRPRPPENLAYHAARLLLVISLCGTPRRGTVRRGIRGRTLLAKLDFFVRYPSYLSRALDILSTARPSLATTASAGAVNAESDAADSGMVRYLYGPWDHVYYATLGYMVGKGLIEVQVERGTEVFRLTEAGVAMAATIGAHPAYGGLAARAALVHRAFADFTGTRLKQFIYNHFPDIVARKIGAAI